MTHESHSTALGSRAEEGHANLVTLELLGIGHHGLPGLGATGVLVILECGNVGTEASISLHNATISNL